MHSDLYIVSQPSQTPPSPSSKRVADLARIVEFPIQGRNIFGFLAAVTKVVTALLMLISVGTRWFNETNSPQQSNLEKNLIATENLVDTAEFDIGKGMPHEIYTCPGIQNTVTP